MLNKHDVKLKHDRLNHFITKGVITILFGALRLCLSQLIVL